MSHATRFHHFRYQKKKGNRFIIPATFFIPQGSEKQAVEKAQPTPTPVKKSLPATTTEKAPSEKEGTPVKNIDLNKKEKTSGLSLKSIREKKALLAKLKEKEGETKEKQNEPYTANQVAAAWDEYAKHLKKHGNHNLASIISADLPQLKENKIHIEMPTETMKVELLRGQNQLMGYIRKNLKNDYIQLEITVNEKAEKKFIFTPREKYEKLREKNPLIDQLRRTFDLDL